MAVQLNAYTDFIQPSHRLSVATQLATLLPKRYSVALRRSATLGYSFRIWKVNQKALLERSKTGLGQLFVPTMIWYHQIWLGDGTACEAYSRPHITRRDIFKVVKIKPNDKPNCIQEALDSLDSTIRHGWRVRLVIARLASTQLTMLWVKSFEKTRGYKSNVIADEFIIRLSNSSERPEKLSALEARLFLTQLVES